MIQKFTKKRVAIEVSVLFVIHFVISYVLKNFGNQTYSWKIQIVESIIFSVIMVAIYWGLDKWNKQWKSK